jgi:uncharacterized alkaline shock family protein YloU
MSRDYYYLENYHATGQMGISRRSFETIATIAANEVKDATVTPRDSRLFHLSHPVHAYFRKGGQVEIHIDVTIAKSAPVKDVCLKIQEAVASAIQMMCEAIPFAVEVKVLGVK